MATQPQPNEELVKIFDTMQESEAMVVRGLLDAAGIPTLTTSLDAPQDVYPGVGGVIIRVPAERAEEARTLIEDYRNTSVEEIEAAEEQSENPTDDSAA